MIEELKTLHEEAVREDPGRSEVNVWASLIMAEKVSRTHFNHRNGF